LEHSISAADANRHFSLVLRTVREGGSYVVTSHGKPVARVVPAGQHEAVTTASRDLLIKRLAAQPVIDVGSWQRDELYEDQA
jgi:prevent-host-death family protein